MEKLKSKDRLETMWEELYAYTYVVLEGFIRKFVAPNFIPSDRPAMYG